MEHSAQRQAQLYIDRIKTLQHDQKTQISVWSVPGVMMLLGADREVALGAAPQDLTSYIETKERRVVDAMLTSAMFIRNMAKMMMDRCDDKDFEAYEGSTLLLAIQYPGLAPSLFSHIVTAAMRGDPIGASYLSEAGTCPNKNPACGLNLFMNALVQICIRDAESLGLWVPPIVTEHRFSGGFPEALAYIESRKEGWLMHIMKWAMEETRLRQEKEDVHDDPSYWS